jgi:hypothetical protein
MSGQIVSCAQRLPQTVLHPLSHRYAELFALIPQLTPFFINRKVIVSRVVADQNVEFVLVPPAPLKAVLSVAEAAYATLENHEQVKPHPGEKCPSRLTNKLAVELAHSN